MTSTIDLTKQAPRSPKEKLGGYILLARAIDKCRAKLANKLGEYNFDSPLDNMLFSFKGIKGAEFKEAVAKCNSDQEVLAWFSSSGTKKTQSEIDAWSSETSLGSLYNVPSLKDFFVGECKKLSLNPEKTTTFDWLDTDDRASFNKAKAA